MQAQDRNPKVQGLGKKQFLILLVFRPAYHATSTKTYPDMQWWMHLVDEPKIRRNLV